MIFGILWLLFGVVGFSLDVERGKSGLNGLVIGGLLGPFGLYFMIYSESEQPRKLYLSITNILIVLLISIGVYQTLTKDTKDKSDDLVLKDIKVLEENSYKSSPKFLRKEKITKLENELKTFDTPFDNSQYRGSLGFLKNELKLFNNWSKLIEENEGDTSEVVEKLINKLKSKVISLQKKEFPLMRKEYCVVVNRINWIDDIEIKCQGSKNTTIRFIGSFFSLNRNISLTQEKYQHDLRHYRFKKSQYLWFKYDEDYSTYDLLSPEDNEIRYFPNLNETEY